MNDLKDDAEKGWSSWGLRPIVLFAAVYMVIGIVHEFSHAIAAYSLGIPFTLLHLHLNLNRTIGTPNQRAIIGVAGPLIALCIGLLCWIAYIRVRDSRFGLPLLYAAWFGAATFFGNLISTAFVGDFSRLAMTLQWSSTVRYVISVVGVLSLCSWSFLVGKELRAWAPVSVSAAKATIGMIVIPAVVGTPLLLLMFLPMPLTYAYGRIAESLFWIPGSIAAWIKQESNMTAQRKLQLGWGDVVLFLLAAAVVRLMAAGITFQT
jgi:hypothetical protein